MNKMNTRGPLCALFVCLVCGGLANAGPIIAVDENGHGFAVPGGAFSGNLRPDPGPGGFSAVLTFDLPFLATPGDVPLESVEPGLGSVIGDVIRFNGNGTLVFYSDNVPISDSLADTASPPSFLYPNIVTLSEIGGEGSNGAIYTPLPGQPGFDQSGPTYILRSDGDIPEPATGLLLITGFTVVVGRLRRSPKRVFQAGGATH